MRRRAVLGGGLALLAGSAARAAEGDWVLLGERQVGWLIDADVIPVGVSDGRYDHIRFEVSGNGIFIRDIDVIYSNGGHDHIVTQFHIREGGRSRVINLRGGDRNIRRVQFRYSQPARRFRRPGETAAVGAAMRARGAAAVAGPRATSGPSR